MGVLLFALNRITLTMGKSPLYGLSKLIDAARFLRARWASNTSLTMADLQWGWWSPSNAYGRAAGKKTSNSCNNNSHTFYSRQYIYSSSPSLRKELDENLQHHQGGVNEMQSSSVRHGNQPTTERALFDENSIQIKSTLLPLRLFKLQVLPDLSAHLVYPCVRTTSTASSMCTSSVFFYVWFSWWFSWLIASLLTEWWWVRFPH